MDDHPLGLADVFFAFMNLNDANPFKISFQKSLNAISHDDVTLT